MYPDDVVRAALLRCPPLATRTLEDFLEPLLDLHPASLAELPGAPGQVLCAQFLDYAQRAVSLRARLIRSDDRGPRLLERVLRLPVADRPAEPDPCQPPAPLKRSFPDGSDPSDPASRAG